MNHVLPIQLFKWNVTETVYNKANDFAAKEGSDNRYKEVGAKMFAGSGLRMIGPMQINSQHAVRDPNIDWYSFNFDIFGKSFTN